MAGKGDNFDDFFDTPRNKSVDDGRIEGKQMKQFDDGVSRNSREPIGKPPAHPSSRPSSAVSKNGYSDSSLSERSPNKNVEHNEGQRRHIEAKLPVVLHEELDDDSYSDDSFIQEDDGSSDDGNSGRRSPFPSEFKPKFPPRKEELKERHVQNRNGEGQLSDCSDSDDLAGSDESGDSEITDVSPLNTPHSPNLHQKSSGTFSKNKNSGLNRQQTNTIGLLDGNSDSVDLDKLLETVLHMEKQGKVQQNPAQTHLVVPQPKSRPNYSFTNEQLRAIDKENERLLNSIFRQQQAANKAKKKLKKTPVPPAHRTRPQSSAAVNRAKQRQKIEAENLMLLHRLQQVRPSRELRRDVLMRGPGATSAGQTPSGMARPGSATRSRPASAVMPQRQRPKCPSRPGTAFPRRLDDDNVITWQTEDF